MSAVGNCCAAVRMTASFFRDSAPDATRFAARNAWRTVYLIGDPIEGVTSHCLHWPS
jgi:hypothetical protein